MGLTLVSLWTLAIWVYAENTDFHAGIDDFNQENTGSERSKVAFEPENDQSDVSKAAKRKEMEQVSASQINGENAAETLRSGCPFLRSQQQGGWLFALGTVATGTEEAYLCMYREVKKHPVLHLVCFYLGMIYVLYKVLFPKAKSNPQTPQYLVVLQDSNPHSFEAQLTAELGRFKELLKKRQDGLKATQTPVFGEAENQLNDILTSHQEFQQEILDSHLMIVQELQSHVQSNSFSVPEYRS